MIMTDYIVSGEKSWNLGVKHHAMSCSQPFPKQQILDASKLKEFAEDNFKFDEKTVESSPNE